MLLLMAPKEAWREIPEEGLRQEVLTLLDTSLHSGGWALLLLLPSPLLLLLMQLWFHVVLAVGWLAGDGDRFVVSAPQEVGKVGRHVARRC